MFAAPYENTDDTDEKYDLALSVSLRPLYLPSSNVMNPVQGTITDTDASPYFVEYSIENVIESGETVK